MIEQGIYFLNQSLHLDFFYDFYSENAETIVEDFVFPMLVTMEDEKLLIDKDYKQEFCLLAEDLVSSQVFTSNLTADLQNLQNDDGCFSRDADRSY